MRAVCVGAAVGVMVAAVFGAGQMPLSDANLLRYGELQNCRARFEREKRGHVAFIGGSITEMNGYRPMVMAILEKRFPDTEFTFTDAGISSTCSTTGAFRLREHVLSKGPVDLFFVEFAVNDDQDAAHASRECLRGMEGIVRRTRLHNPRADIVMTFFVNPGMLELWRAGKEPVSTEAHTRVAKHYGVPVIDLGKELADQVNAGKFTWEAFGGVHPKEPGNRLCANMIDRLMALNWDYAPRPLRTGAYIMPEPIDARSYYRGRLLDPAAAALSDGAALHVPDWKALKGSLRKRFAGRKLVCLEKPGAELTLQFEGTAVGAYILAGPDAGVVEVSIDGGPVGTHDLYHRFSRGLHYPRTVVFDADLAEGKHAMKLRVSDQAGSQGGHAVRVLNFVAN